MVDQHWFNVAQIITWGVVFVIAWIVKRAYSAGKWVSNIGEYHTKALGELRADVEEIKDDLSARCRNIEEGSQKRLKELERETYSRFDKAGVQMSNMATKVQQLPTELRRDFVLQAVYFVQQEETRDERNRIRIQIEQLWSAVRHERKNPGE